MTRFWKQLLFAGAAVVLVAGGWLSWSRVRPSPGAGLESDAAIVPLSRDRAASDVDAPPVPTAMEGRMMRGVVRAHEVDAWTLRFTAGRPAAIWVDGDGGTGLDCVAQDAAGNLLDADADELGRCRLRWVPARTGSYRILVRNPGSAPVTYQLVAR